MDSIRYVNRRYKKPEIETTLFVKICLLALRAYLLLMVALMGYALVKQASAPQKSEQTAPSVQSTPASTPSSAPATLQAQ
jgi:hypothetical protein